MESDREISHAIIIMGSANWNRALGQGLSSSAVASLEGIAAP